MKTPAAVAKAWARLSTAEPSPERETVFDPAQYEIQAGFGPHEYAQAHASPTEKKSMMDLCVVDSLKRTERKSIRTARAFLHEIFLLCTKRPRCDGAQWRLRRVAGRYW